ncbi:TonB-dependent receptor [Methylomonas sp. SURF-2]|uniref:TonB-dependent receptor n=1 Tax=Methylomonas subterranea TaxID=2952225 RepID=A0ABT1TEH3_9GAMM|nr:TonB-dependent receptor [Methylomonas sp. SURF-2]MCQ8103858.1 TonB-dependent receptor [Methylomonas sp. SURF-2]
MPAYPLTIAALLCFGLLAHAEELRPLATESADEQDLLFSELPSVFSASRHEQPVTKAPASVDIITSEQIKRYGWRTVSALLGSLPGFISTYDRAYHHNGVRGFAPPGDYNTRILVLIDGHRVNESLQDYAGLGRDFLVDMANIERVEVVRGPASALYGSSALFAVVNVITQRGRDLQGVRLSADLGSYGTHRGQVSHGQKFSNGMESFISASHFYSDGRENLSFPGLGTAHNLDQEEVERLHGKLAWDDFTLSGSWMGRKKYLPTGTTGTTFGEPQTNYRDRRAYADLNYHHSFSADWDVTGRAFWDSYEFDDVLPYRAAGGPVTVNKDLWRGQWFGAELMVSRTFFDSHRLTVGSEYRRNFRQLMLNHDVEPYFLWANTRETSSIYGIYLQDEWTILPNLSLQAGARYDHYDNFGGTFNPRLGLIAEPFDGTTLKLLYGTAFRAPNAFESVYTCCADSTPWIGNSGLKPEEIESYEFVWEQRLGSYADLRVSPYYNRLSNLINLTVSPSEVRQFQNQGNAEAHGLETQLKGHYENFEGRFSHTYQQSRIAGYVAAPNAARHMLKLNLGAPLWSDKLFAGLEVQYVSSRATIAGNRLPNYSLTNLTLTSRRWLPGLELSGGLYNLFNERYADPASPPLSPDSISQDGRNFRLRMIYEF